MELSTTTKTVAGILLITLPTIEYGGVFLLRMLKAPRSGYMENPLRQNLFRAGHAHAGVLAILSLVCQLYADGLSVQGATAWIARMGAPCAAILMPLGFFFSMAAPDSQKPNRWLALVYAGATFLAIGTLALGIVLVRGG